MDAFTCEKSQLSSCQDNPRKAFAQFATGVCIVVLDVGNTCFYGLTINSFSSLSLEPLLVSFSIKTESIFFKRIMNYGNSFTINILNQEQCELSNLCARSGGAKLGATELCAIGDTTYIQGSVASYKCRVAQKLLAGDHTLFVCEVKDLLVSSKNDPLIFFDSKYRSLV